MRFKIFIFLFIIIFVLSACSKETEKKEDEILMARECGIDGFKCCNEEPACSFGQECCVDPNNESRNYCSDSCDFGKINTFCLRGGECELDLVCLNGYCDVCGGEEEFCCPGNNTCDSGFSCLDDVCVKCGEIDNPCCANSKCFSDGDKRMECRNNKCSYCGFDDNIACFEGDKCAIGNLYNNGNCLRCGNYNNPCCDADLGVGYRCDSDKNLVCNSGFCIKAGKSD